MKAQFNWPYKNVNGTLVTDVPQRDAGQQSALNLVTPKMKVVRVAFVGLGMRGPTVNVALVDLSSPASRLRRFATTKKAVPRVAKSI